MKNEKNILYTAIVVIITVFVTVGGLMASGYMLKVPYSDLKYYKEFATIANEVEKTYYKDVNKKAMFEGAYKGMLESLGDEYSEYFNENEAKDIYALTTNSYIGIGAVFGVEKDKKVMIVSVMDDSPAKDAGLKSGDEVLTVNSKEVNSANLNKTVSMIKSRENQEITMVVLREGKKNTLKMKTRNVKLKSVGYDMIDKNIGYIAISSFSNDTADEFEDAVGNLKKKGMKALIIDLRGNGGGLVDSSVRISDDLLGDATIFTQKYKYGKTQVAKSDKNKIVDVPIAILIDKNTASASEIFTGAMVDNNAAVAIGEKSYGKGVTQALNKVGNGDLVKVTVSEYLTPSGKSINKKGIEPSIKIKKGEDIQKKAVEYLKTKIK